MLGVALEAEGLRNCGFRMDQVACNILSKCTSLKSEGSRRAHALKRRARRLHNWSRAFGEDSGRSLQGLGIFVQSVPAPLLFT